jgi:NADH-quinone oxidoreductase subunit C
MPGAGLTDQLNNRQMDTNLFIEQFKKEFNTEILDIAIKNQKRITITMKADAVLRISGYLYHSAGFRFIIATALQSKRGFEIHYHFSKDIVGLILNIHIILDKDNPQVESLSNIFNASNWIEREIHELYGINFLNHPNLEKLISEGNWAEGVYPLRKEFT